MPANHTMQLYFKRHGAFMHLGKKSDPPPPASTRHIKNAAIRRLAYRGGIARLNKRAYDAARKELHSFVHKVLDNATKFTDHCRRKTIMKKDMHEALKKAGVTLYE